MLAKSGRLRGGVRSSDVVGHATSASRMDEGPNSGPSGSIATLSYIPTVEAHLAEKEWLHWMATARWRY